MQFKKTIKDFFTRLLRPRDFMIREQDSISFCSLSQKQQAVLFVIVCGHLCWSVFTSFYFLRSNPLLIQKSEDLKRLSAEYSDLKDEMLTFKDYMDQMIVRIDETEQKLAGLKIDRTEVDSDQPKIRKIDSFPIAAEKEDKSYA